MPLIRKAQFLNQVETLPGTQVSAFVAADFTEVLDGSVSEQRAKIDSVPASPFLSPIVEGMGRGSRSVSCQVDARGSGTAGTTPDYSKLLEACGWLKQTVSTLTFDGSGLTRVLKVGDILYSGSITGATAIVLGNYAIAATTVNVFLAGGSAAFANGETITSLNAGATCGVLAGSGAVGDQTGTGLTWHPTSIIELQFTTTGSWSGTAIAGDVVTVTVAGLIVGALLLTRAPATTTTYAEWLFGTLPAAATLASTSGGTATVAGSPAITQLKSKTLSVAYNRAGVRKVLYGARGTWVMNVEAGSTGKFTFNLTGKIGVATDLAFTAATTVPTTIPPRLIGGYVMVNGIPIPTKSVQADCGCNVIMSPDANSPEGDSQALITARVPKFVIKVDQVGVTTFDWWTKRDAGTLVSIGALLGTAAGNQLAYCAPRGQITEIVDDDQDGVATHTITVECKRINSDSDDELVIAHL